MRLALTLGYSGARMTLDMELVHEVERLGYDSIWSAESYGSDAVTPVAWIAALTTRLHVGTGIMQMAGRTPAATAMTAMTLDGLSGGRFRLGLGVSGPQVVEGWHGQPFGRPLRRTREYVAIVRSILRREKPLEHRGEDYQIPYAGSDATGLGKPLKSILHGRPDLPIYLAAVGPKNVALAAEIADGWIPTFFSVRRMKLFREWLPAGFSARGAAPSAFDIMPMVAVVVGDDVDACRASVKARLALYVGEMGAAGATSTTTSRAATATKTPQRRFRISTWRAARPRRRPPYPMDSSTRWRSAVRASAFASSPPSGAPRA